jgi:hypothetical protein
MLSPPGNPPQLITGLKGALSIRLHIRYVTSGGSGRIEKDADEQQYKVGASCEGPTRPTKKPKEARWIRGTKNKSVLRRNTENILNHILAARHLSLRLSYRSNVHVN